jgi:hypothetical protein
MISSTFQIASESNLVSNIVYCTGFRFIRDVYTPYAELTASYLCLNTPLNKPAKARLLLNGNIAYEGVIDKIKFSRFVDSSLCTVHSRSFTSALLQNEITPGLHNNLTFNALMDNFITLPNITHESNSSGTNYIFVKPGSSMWEAVSNFCYKVYGTHPYISGTNKINVSHKSNPTTFTRTTSNCIGWGEEYDFSNAISHFHMADIDGNYGVYNYTDSSVTVKNIVRHKHYELDRQYLENPQNALLYRSKMSKRRLRSVFCIYDSYDGEELGDILNLSGVITVSNRRINRIEIVGKSSPKGSHITTKISAYIDGFFV